MNRIFLSGRLATDPTIGESNGNKYAYFNIAVNNGKRNAENEWLTDFYHCTAWRFTADKAEKMHKGNRVVLSGRISTSTYRAKTGEDRISLDVDILDIELMDLPPKAPATDDEEFSF